MTVKGTWTEMPGTSWNELLFSLWYCVEPHGEIVLDPREEVVPASKKEIETGYPPWQVIPACNRDGREALPPGKIVSLPEARSIHLDSCFQPNFRDSHIVNQ
jgi:hypothetical protein